MSNPFSKYTIKPFEAKIKALDDATVTLKKLSIGEYEAILSEAIVGFDKDNNPIIDEKKGLGLNYLIASAALVQPKMSVEQLKALHKDAQSAIIEIVDLVVPKEDTEGN